MEKHASLSEKTILSDLEEEYGVSLETQICDKGDENIPGQKQDNANVQSKTEIFEKGSVVNLENSDVSKDGQKDAEHRSVLLSKDSRVIEISQTPKSRPSLSNVAVSCEQTGEMESDKVHKIEHEHLYEKSSTKQIKNVIVCKQKSQQVCDSSAEIHEGKEDHREVSDSYLKEPCASIVTKPKSNQQNKDEFSILDCGEIMDKNISSHDDDNGNKSVKNFVDENVEDVNVKNFKDDMNENVEDSHSKLLDFHARSEKEKINPMGVDNECKKGEPSESGDKVLEEDWKTYDSCERTESAKSVSDICEPHFKKQIISENIEKQNASDSQSRSKKSDPFTLSGDEDFSPKAYKPIKRKFNPGFNNIICGMSPFDEFLEDEEKENGMGQKRQKVIRNSPPLVGHKPPCVAYVHSKGLVERANKLIRIEGRANLVHSLIEIYGILNHVDVIPPRLATDTEILGFHCPMYIEFLKKLTDCDDPSDSVTAEAEAYGLSYDCPLQEEVFKTAALISGATIAAAETLINGQAGIAINWCGGWHHAKRDSASGFCYINDIVLGILKLREKFDNVLYVDLDLHHGDGVEEAFAMTRKVMTVSFHKYACGFFPGTGSIEDVGSGRGKMYTVNVPLMDGVGDARFVSIFTDIMKKVRDKFSGEAIVIQCGADSLSEDPMASFNLTHLAIARCVCFLLTWNLPTLLLGGGGYNFPNTAKCWTFLTAMAAGKKLPVDIPEHEHLLEYGPTYELTTSKGNRKDNNTNEHFTQVLSKIYKNLDCL